MQEFEIPIPSSPTDPNDRWEQDIHKKRVKQYVTRQTKYESNKTALYTIVWGQCSEAMQSKNQGKMNFEDIEKRRDSLALLKEIKCYWIHESRGSRQVPKANI